MRPPFVLSGLLALVLAGHALTAGAKDAQQTPVQTAPVAPPAPSATCDIVGLRLEDVIAKSPELQRSANEQTVRDLRTLRDAAVVLDAYRHPQVCAQVLAVLRGLAANPEKAIDQSGDTDEEKAEAVEKARTPKAPETSPGKMPETKAK
ncbi:photosystem reaction center subunit H [Methylobacterium sp. SyP6R]|uniref:photosystem reaction center subunit H n=1 Tax=Methylobacterium sp. SyP6R TaxID=2718876 RepID=UPI001F310899|nr:photosystem reaction center subunit H [Methylobacterium sp. SyP6R]MCF4126474.1 photosystem reaction center subunit H [Methylobacterium sp. SyP6R]